MTHNSPTLRQDFHFLEFFAGTARVTEAFRSSGYLAGRFDIMYHTPDADKSNFMDLSAPSGFLLLICNQCLQPTCENIELSLGKTCFRSLEAGVFLHSPLCSWRCDMLVCHQIFVFLFNERWHEQTLSLQCAGFG